MFSRARTKPVLIDSLTTTHTDEELMLRYKDGDQAAFEQLFDRYERPLQGMLSRRLGFNHAIAAEVSQETWLAVIKASASYQPTATFRTYLHHIAHNKLNDFFRKQNRDAGYLAAPIDECDETQMEISPQPNPEQQYSQQQTQQQLSDALQRLPEHHRTILLYCGIHQMSVPEAAEILDIPLERAKSRLRQAKAALRNLLQPSSSLED